MVQNPFCAWCDDGFYNTTLRLQSVLSEGARSSRHNPGEYLLRDNPLRHSYDSLYGGADNVPPDSPMASRADDCAGKGMIKLAIE